jgi:hemerythrin
MSMFQWKPEYSVGYAQIDEQHKRLFELADELHDAMIAGKAKQILGKTLGSLIAYTKAHFATEERLMRAYQYPDYAKHKAAHDELTAQVVKFEKEFQGAGLATTLTLLPFLRAWLIHHIGETDRKIASYLKSKTAA